MALDRPYLGRSADFLGYLVGDGSRPTLRRSKRRLPRLPGWGWLSTDLASVEAPTSSVTWLFHLRLDFPGPVGRAAHKKSGRILCLARASPRLAELKKLLLHALAVVFYKPLLFTCYFNLSFV
jgi:hypothetical protein